MNIVGGLVDVHGTESLYPSVAVTLFLAGTVLIRNAAVIFCSVLITSQSVILESESTICSRLIRQPFPNNSATWLLSKFRNH
jgi:hypothetical protein